MLATTHAVPLLLNAPLCPAARPPSASTSRPALADSTNISSYFPLFDPASPKGFSYPVSSARSSCSWSDIDSSTSTHCHSRHRHWSSTHSLFPVTQKAPPTVSISLSAACLQGTSAERPYGSRLQGSELDLPDVTSVVPFPSASLAADTDVEMLDGTCISCPDGHPPSSSRAPRKRRSAHSSVSSSQSSPGKEAKQKRPRKSRQQVAELLWLGIVYRSVLRGIEARQLVCDPDDSTSSLPERRDFDVMDRLLVERIQKRLADNGCTEARLLPKPLPRISLPSISGPSLNLAAPSALLTEPDRKARDPLEVLPEPTAPSRTPDSPIPLSTTTSTSLRPHVRFDIPPRPRQPHLSIPRRSPSPPVRAESTSASTQTLTLAMPQLVASLMLAHHERSRPRLRGRPYKVVEHEKNAGRSSNSLSWVPLPGQGQTVQRRSDSDVIRDKERTRRSCTPRARISPTERKSPLSRIAFVES